MSTSPQESTPIRVAVMTMTRDEAAMLPRWVGYYGSQVGNDNLFVIDDNSVDQSTDQLPCTVLHMPPGPWKRNWMQTRVDLVNSLTRGLLTCFDVVIFTDVDEFLVPDPQHHDGLRAYLDARASSDALAPLGLNVLHDPGSEPPLEAGRPVLSQRRLVKFAPGMCKPLVKRRPAPWLQGFHGIKAPYVVDPELLLLHLKYADEQALADVADRRQKIYVQERRGSGKSTWPLGAETLQQQVRQWVAEVHLGEVRELSSDLCDLSQVVHEMPSGYFRSRGPEDVAESDNPLMLLPERFRSVV